MKIIDPKNSTLSSISFITFRYIISFAYITRPEVSEGGPLTTILIKGVPSEETDSHRKIAVSISFTRMDLLL